jgi:hypothetical protein
METKQDFIKYLQELYSISKKPLLKSKITKKNGYLCNARVECNKFGKWENILNEANLPKYYNEPIEVKCKICFIKFKKRNSQINDINDNHFCSRSCSAKFNNHNRIITEDHKKNIRIGMKKYTENKFIIPFRLLDGIKNCEGCDKEFEYDTKRFPNQKYCSHKCGAKYGGKKGGIISASRQKKKIKIRNFIRWHVYKLF